MRLFPVHRCVGLALPALLIPTLAVAQTEPVPEADETLLLEEFVITGSNIYRLDVETALPVTTLNEDYLEQRGVSTGVELLELLPSVVDVPINETGTLGASARGDVASISLRGIGSGNTLLLLNGRRLPPHPITQAEAGTPSLSPNANSLPGFNVDRIEILRDGASAIYGTDAVAGVVNTILRTHYRGAELRARYAWTDEGGAEETRVQYRQGFKLGKKTHLTLMASYLDREELAAADRAYSVSADASARAPAPWNSTDSDFDATSTGSLFGQFQIGSPGVEGQWVGVRPSGVSSSNVASTGIFYFRPSTSGDGSTIQTGSSPSRTRATDDPYYFNLNRDRLLLPGSQRFNGYAAIEHQLNDRVTLFGEFNLYWAESQITREPNQISSSVDDLLFIPTTNYYNPYGERFYTATQNPDEADRSRSPGLPNADGTPRLVGTPRSILITNKRFEEFGIRQGTVESLAWRALAGARGTIADKFRWESAILYGLANTTDVETNNIRRSRLSASLLKSTPDAFNALNQTFAISGTNPTQPTLTGAYTNPASVIDPLKDDFAREGETTLALWDAKLTGPLFRLFGNEVRFAVGLEARNETFLDSRPPYAGLVPAGEQLYAPGDPNAVDTTGLANDFIAFSPNSDTDADRDVLSVFGELLVPLLGSSNNLPLVQKLELSLAGRFESYSDFGDTAKPKIGLTWQPTGFLLFRGSYAEGFKAPNLAQLFEGELARATGITDDYRIITGQPSDGNIFRSVFRNGNRDLTPEESVTYTAGFVFEPQWKPLKGLTVTGDLWVIEQSDVIDNLDSGFQLDLDVALLEAATQAALAAGQSITSLDLTGQGNPNVVRAPVSSSDLDSFNEYNADPDTAPDELRGAVGPILYVNERYLNLASRDISGFDYEVEYRFPRLPFGTLTVSHEGSFLLKFKELLDNEPGTLVDDEKDEDGKAEYRGNLAFTFRSGPVTAGLSANYVGGWVDGGATVTSTTYNNLGQPDYIKPFVSSTTGNTLYGYEVDDVTVWNTYVLYRVKSSTKLLDGLGVRLGINNITNEPPPLADNSRGFDTSGVVSARGRQFSIELRKTF